MKIDDKIPEINIEKLKGILKTHKKEVSFKKAQEAEEVKVEFSKKAEELIKIREYLDSIKSSKSEKVEKIKKLISCGEYKIDFSEVARKLIRENLIDILLER